VFFEELAKLFLEGLLPVMGLLTLDVPNHAIGVGSELLFSVPGEGRRSDPGVTGAAYATKKASK
jgi:hypothetical protein